MIRLDDLNIHGYHLYQDTDCFCFGTDAVLLSWFAARKKYKKAFDLCSGNGVVGILLAARNDNASVCGIEIDEKSWSLSLMSVKENRLEDRVRFFNGDLREFPYSDPEFSTRFDLVSVNPPYSPLGSGQISQKHGQARSELTCTLDDVCSASSKLLNYHGRLCLIIKPERLSELIFSMKQNGIEPKSFVFVSARPEKKPELVLAEGLKGGNSGSVVENLFLYDGNGELSQKTKEIYGR